MSGLPTISLVSTAIGFISFAFTLSTFFKVIGGNLATLAAAPNEVPYYLSNVKQELFEERLHLRRARRRAERSLRRHRRNNWSLPPWDSGPTIRLMEATIRQLCREFREIERPFLLDKSSTESPTQREAKLEDARREKVMTEDYLNTGFTHDYGSVTLYHRFSWLMRKSSVVRMMDGLERLQVRRISRETTDALNELKKLRDDLGDLHLVPGRGEAGGAGGPGGGTKAERGAGGAGGRGASVPVRSDSRGRHGAKTSPRHGGPGGGGGSSGENGAGVGRRRPSRPRSAQGHGRRGHTGRDDYYSDSDSDSDSSESSDTGADEYAAREKTERVHVRRTRRQSTGR